MPTISAEQSGRVRDVQTSLVLANRTTPMLVTGIAEQSAATGRPITDEAWRNASALLALLPDFVPDPDFAIEKDGQLSFDWQIDQDHALSLNVGKGGRMGFSILNGLEYSFGKVPFTGALPRSISEQMAVLFSESPQDR